MTADQIYREKLTSNKTEALFVALTLVFLMLAVWRASVGGFDALAITLIVFFGFFLFCSLNYRTLFIHITSQSLKLTFGMFTWSVPVENIEACRLDELPALMKYGGAGIHFMMIRNRYRVSFNFLEYPRVTIALRKKAGLVRDVPFSTRQPEDALRFIREMAENRLLATRPP
jgi:hypothetical protein